MHVCVFVYPYPHGPYRCFPEICTTVATALPLQWVRSPVAQMSMHSMQTCDRRPTAPPSLPTYAASGVSLLLFPRRRGSSSAWWKREPQESPKGAEEELREGGTVIPSSYFRTQVEMTRPTAAATTEGHRARPAQLPRPSHWFRLGIQPPAARAA